MVFMKKKDLIFSLLAMLGLVCVGGWHFISQNQAQAVKAEARKTFIQSSRPTIFFHGWGSSSRVANFDDGRCALALEALARLGEERQILLFTCHSREARLAEGREGAAVLRLQS